MNLYNQSGKALEDHRHSAAQANYGFLQGVFTYSGAGSVEFDSWFDPPAGSPDWAGGAESTDGSMANMNSSHNGRPCGRHRSSREAYSRESVSASAQ
jgi:hypothetical protein